MVDLWDFHNLYLMTDIFPLADRLVTFRKMCLTKYNIDPSHSRTAPVFSWHAALRMASKNDVELELVTDPNIHQIIEQVIHGAISTITHRHADASDQQALLYIDANNLYGHAMNEPLPTGNFKLHYSAN
jgi:hypothetical protein